jgi:large subunit ribosomal protein L5
MAYVPRLKQEYATRVIKSLQEEFGYKNVMQVPKLQKNCSEPWCWCCSF